jgi:hypothetical protein
MSIICTFLIMIVLKIGCMSFILTIFYVIFIFCNNVYKWLKNLHKIIKYINATKKCPQTNNTNKEIKSLAQWLTSQLHQYNKQKGTMKNEIIKKQWDKFNNDYKIYLNNEYEWTIKFNETKNYIDKTNSRPSKRDKNKKTGSMDN